MSAIEKRESIGEAVERVIVAGDLAKLSAEERVQYYRSLCESVGLNPLTRPFEYITLNGKLTLYARKDATDQLRANNQISIKIVAREVVEGCYVVTAQATTPAGRTDESIGAVPIDALKGEARSNALMKCETKAKRRVTLSICGMGLLDETEVESIPGAKIGETSQPVISEPRTFGKPVTRDIALELMQKAEQERHKLESLPPLAELVEKAKAAAAPIPEPELEHADKGFINREKQLWLIEKFRENLPTKYQHGPIADQMRRGWLKSEGFVNEKDEGTSSVIPDKQFKKVAAAMLNWAKEQE